MTENKRRARLYDFLKKDQRSRYQRDRDRIIYTTAFSRLSGITQVISPSENRICHNRLIHSIKVSQIAKRIAENIIKKYPNSSKKIGINPDVVEAASLAHDIGHPPFGHAAEIQLQKCIEKLSLNRETYEGNAQSFRVVTRLAIGAGDFPGLDLTRATLNALLKYPYKWDNSIHKTKWGVYLEDADYFDWARKPLLNSEKDIKTVEAEIMDIADDITYAVHDLDDFFRAGIMPVDRLIKIKKKSGKGELAIEGEKFLNEVFKRNSGNLPTNKRNLKNAFVTLMTISGIFEPYNGLRKQKAQLRYFTSSLIGYFVRNLKLNIYKTPGDRVYYDNPSSEWLVFLLKQLTWHYIIMNPALSTQQYGQKTLIEKIFDFYYNAILTKDCEYLPQKTQELLDQMPPDSRMDDKKQFCARHTADIISSMTEFEAKCFAHKILGISFGSVFDPIY